MTDPDTILSEKCNASKFPRRTQTFIRHGTETESFKRIVNWFNSWLEEPLSEREKTIIHEAIIFNNEKERIRDRYI